MSDIIAFIVAVLIAMLGAVTPDVDDAGCVELPPGVTWPRLDYHGPTDAWVLDGRIIGYSAEEDDDCITPA